MTEFLTFKLRPNITKIPQKTQKYLVCSAHSGDVLGEIYWRNGWRRYVMHFEQDCDWSVECMAQCYKFIQKLMNEREVLRSEPINM